MTGLSPKRDRGSERVNSDRSDESSTDHSHFIVFVPSRADGSFIPDLYDRYDLTHVAGCELYDLNNLAHVSWVGSSL